MDIQDKNFRTETKSALKIANKAWTDCIANNFLGQWLNGANIAVTDVCKDELQRMQELDAEVYGELPFKIHNII